MKNRVSSASDALFEPQALAALRAGCRLYLHGHSVGGFQPFVDRNAALPPSDSGIRLHIQSPPPGGPRGYFTSAAALEQCRTPDLQAWTPQPDDPAFAHYRWTAIARAYSRLCQPEVMA
ncbi:MAG: hypothetical protein R3E55_08305 [Burkholderiaceae bacterium]